MSNIKELAKYVAHHVNQRGKFYGKFPVSNGYIFTASDISSSHIYFHLEKDDHHRWPSPKNLCKAYSNSI